jgi:hypothetical protein
MISESTLWIQGDRPSRIETFGSIHDGQAENIRARSEESAKFEMSEPNRDSTAGTQQEHMNGDSSSLTIKLGQWRPIPPSMRQPLEYFNVLQKWEGGVVEVTGDTFWARLTPIVSQDPEPDQLAEIYLEQVDEEDLNSVEPGAVFYWSIGYYVKSSGTKMGASLIRFRRLPVWTKHELEAAEREARQLLELFDDNKPA